MLTRNPSRRNPDAKTSSAPTSASHAATLGSATDARSSRRFDAPAETTISPTSPTIRTSSRSPRTASTPSTSNRKSSGPTRPRYEFRTPPRHALGRATTARSNDSDGPPSCSFRDEPVTLTLVTTPRNEALDAPHIARERKPSRRSRRRLDLRPSHHGDDDPGTIRRTAVVQSFPRRAVSSLFSYDRDCDTSRNGRD